MSDPLWTKTMKYPAASARSPQSALMWFKPIRLYTCKASRKRKILVCPYTSLYVQLFDLCKIMPSFCFEGCNVVSMWIFTICVTFLQSHEVNTILQAFSSVAPPAPSSSISLPVLWAELNYISFSHINDVRPPVNTPDGDCNEQLCARCPRALCSARGGSLLVCSAGISIKHRCSRITAGKLAHCHMNRGRKTETVYDRSTL